MIHYKAIRLDGSGFSFRSSALRWSGQPGQVVRHPKPDLNSGPAYSLSASVSPTDCTGMRLPCRLLAVEPVGPVRPDGRTVSGVRAAAWEVIEELPAWQALGPQGREVLALLGRLEQVNITEARRIDSGWRSTYWAASEPVYPLVTDVGADRSAAKEASMKAAMTTMQGVTRGWSGCRASWEATMVAVWALVIRDLTTEACFSALSGSVADVLGPLDLDTRARRQ